MSETLNLTLDGAEELFQAIKKCQKEMPEVMFKYIRRAGNQYKKDYLQKMKARTKKHTGNLYKGARATVEIQKGSLTKYEAQIRGGNRYTKAPHFWLVENGHQGYVLMPDKRLRYIGEVKGKFAMRDTGNEWVSGDKLTGYAVKALDEALKKGLEV